MYECAMLHEACVCERVADVCECTIFSMDIPNLKGDENPRIVERNRTLSLYIVQFFQCFIICYHVHD